MGRPLGMMGAQVSDARRGLVNPAPERGNDLQCAGIYFAAHSSRKSRDEWGTDLVLWGTDGWWNQCAGHLPIAAIILGFVLLIPAILFAGNQEALAFAIPSTVLLAFGINYFVTRNRHRNR